MLYSKVDQLYPLSLDSVSISAITEYWVELLVLCSRFLLVIYLIYGRMYTSVPASQFISPLLSPLVTVNLFSTSVDSISVL